MSKQDLHDEDLLIVDDEDEVLDTKYLMCKLGNEVFGIDIQHVTDIIELQRITEVPDMPPYVKGVINLRGQVIPIIDLRLRFNMEERGYDDRTVITVVNIRNTSIGFIVDTATEVQDIPEKDIDPPPKFQGKDEKERYIAGLGKIGKDVTILLDVEKLVSGERLEEIREAAG